ncbi:hypothetical protein Tco_0407402, partial [Tanacetum coccineum]
EELHQFDRLKVWELVDKPFGKMIIKLKWLWKNKKDEDQTGHSCLDISRPDIVQAVCYCARYRARPTTKATSRRMFMSDALILAKALLDEYSSLVMSLGINPMIQPEPEDLPKDNPKLEIAVLRREELKECWIKGCKQRSPPHNLRQKPGQYICCQNHKLIADIENDIMDLVMQCTTLPSHSEYTRLDIPEFHDTLIQNMDYVKKLIDKRALHKMEYDSRVNERQIQTTEEKIDTSNALDASSVIIESNGTESQKQDTRNI